MCEIERGGGGGGEKRIEIFRHDWLLYGLYLQYLVYYSLSAC